MDMRKYSGPTFIKIADVRDAPLLMQIAAVREGKYDKPDLVFESGDALSINGTNNRTLIRTYGSNSDDWVGREVELSVGQVRFQGELQDTVIIKPISPPIAGAWQEEAATGRPDEEVKDIPF